MQTSWQLGQVSLWQGADVHAQTGACGLLEFGQAWNLPPNSLIPRTTAHFLSGKNSNSGIAWVGVLCSAPFTTSPANLGTTCNAPVSGTGLYGGAYGFTAGIDGNFNIDNPTVVWDILAYSHEVGHNFNSPHTHCYQGLNGNAAAVDNCNAGQCGSTGCYLRDYLVAGRLSGRRPRLRDDHELLPPARRQPRQHHLDPAAEPSLWSRAGAGCRSACAIT